MEERIIDDEYGRGIRLKKTKDGYVDVTDELAEDTGELEGETAAEETDEVSFEFPMMETDEDDEDLVGLTPEEALALKRKKAEAAAKRKEEYEQTCREGEALLEEGSYKSAELKFEKALLLDDVATAASVGYWRAKTEDFTQPDVLADEYVEAGIESLEFDLGYEATDIIKREYRAAFEKRVRELTDEETPLAQDVEGKQQRRRKILKSRLKNTAIAFTASFLPTLVGIILTIVFALKIPTTRGSEYIISTAIAGGVSAVAFIVCIFCSNKFINAIRMHRSNEQLSSTDDGERLLEIREYKELYESLLAQPVLETAEENAGENTDDNAEEAANETEADE